MLAPSQRISASSRNSISALPSSSRSTVRRSVLLVRGASSAPRCCSSTVVTRASRQTTAPWCGCPVATMPQNLSAAGGPIRCGDPARVCSTLPCTAVVSGRFQQGDRAVAQLGSAPRSGRGGRRFKSCQPDQCDVSGHPGQPEPTDVGSGVCFSGWWWRRWLVVAGGVDGEFAEEFAGGGVDDADVEVVDEQDDVGSGVGSADADVVEACRVTRRVTLPVCRCGRGGRGRGCRRRGRSPGAALGRAV